MPAKYQTGAKVRVKAVGLMHYVADSVSSHNSLTGEVVESMPRVGFFVRPWDIDSAGQATILQFYTVRLDTGMRLDVVEQSLEPIES